MRRMHPRYDPAVPTLRIEDLQDADPLDKLQRELAAGLAMYWSAAGHILEGSGITLLDPVEPSPSLAENFFSALFLYSYHCCNIPPSRRIVYVAVNQCLRGMVTGCDNLLDDEYKKTLETDLPEHGYRFRSILDIMVSDRVLFQILTESGPKHGLTRDKVLAASAATLRTLGRSGAQEAAEENGVHEILKPDDVLEKVHHFKTGLLFQSIWAVPLAVEPIEESAVAHLLEALYRIGMGCQILDDMVDFCGDLQHKRHNYIVSLIHHQANPAGRSRLFDLANRNLPLDDMRTVLDAFPGACSAGQQTAVRYLESGLRMLFREEHRFLTAPAIEMMVRRIGAGQLMTVFE